MDPIYPWLDPIEVRNLANQLLRPVKQPIVSVSDAGFSEAFVGFASDRSVPLPAPFETVIDPAPPFEAIVDPPSPQPAPPPFQAVIDPSPPFTAIGKIPREPAPTLEPVPTPEPVPMLEPEPTPEPEPSTAKQDPTSEPALRREPPPIAIKIEETTADSSPDPAILALGPPLARIQRFRDWMAHHFEATGIFILDRDGTVIFDESSHGRLHFLARSLALSSRRPGTTAGNVHVKIGAGATLEVIPVETANGSLVLGAVVPTALSPTAIAAVMQALSEIASPNPG